MQKLIFATSNQHKVNEIKPLLHGKFEIMTLQEAGITIDIPEPYDTLEQNAREKSTTIYRLTGMNCFGEDTGLEVDALNGEPGVRSARYAGEGRAFSKNIEKLLVNLEGETRRSARFKTVISLILNGAEHIFTGVCEGEIIDSPRGTDGFGYDPVFVPVGDNRSFAEMPLADKNKYSHRSKAVAQLVQFLLINENFA